MAKKRNWRGVSDKVAKDKQEIYNSRKWKELTILKKRANPLCEQCIKDGEAVGIPGGYVKSVECVHHIIPIETARTKEEMRRLAFDWNNLMSLCKSCHARIHKELGSNTAKIVRQRAEARQDRWADNLMSKFTINNQGFGLCPLLQNEVTKRTMQENKRLGIFGTLNYEKLKDMTMDERKLAVTNHAKDVLIRKTMDGKGPQIPDDDHDLYDVTAEYTIMDCRYNKQGKILATFKAQRTDEGLTIELVSFEQATI
jgi:5-methylcytosine-specific restriction protein A